MRLLCNSCDEWIKMRDLIEKSIIVNNYIIKYYHCEKCEELLKEQNHE